MISEQELEKISQGLIEALVSVPQLKGSELIGDSAAEALAHVVAAIRDIHALADRVKKLEQRPELKHMGIWREGKSYPVNSLTTLAGSMWICRKATRTARPGSSTCWELVVKRGEARDGR